MSAPRPANNLFSILARIEESVLGIFLVIMILLACVQILLRTVFSSGLSWADPLLRYLVLWSGLLGAAMATSQGKHIALDVISFLVPKSMHPWLHVITDLFSATVAAFLTWAAYLFIRSEMEFGNTQLLSVPSWVWNLIFPIAFALITMRFFMAAWTTAMTILSLKKKRRQLYIMSILKLITVLLALLGSPLFIVISALALLSFHAVGIDLSVIVIEMSRLADTPLLVSLPLFIFAGTLLSESGTPGRMLKLSRLLLGWLPGGLAVISLTVCAIFTAFTGASGVTIFALGGLLLPTLLKDGYSKRFSLGLLTSSGSLGLLFPPSLPLILYGVISESRIDHLFLAGILPGMVMLLLLIVYSMFNSPVRPGEKIRYSGREILQGLTEAAWELPLPIIILGGIYGGFFVAGEAAAVTALYVLVVETFIYKDISVSQLPKIMGKSMMLFGGILVILAASMASTNFLVDQEVPVRLFHFIRTYIDSKYTFLLLLNIFLLIVGCMLDIFSALVLVVPLILPIANGYGVDPIHLGIIFLTNLQIGYSTPPVGLNLFLASYRFETPIVELYRASLPFLALLLLTLVVITYMPWLSLIFIRLWG